MRKAVVVGTCTLVALVLVGAETGLFPLLKTTVLVGKQPEGFYLLPTNQLLRPWGEQVPIKGRPVDIAIDSRKNLLAVLNWRGVLLFDATSGAQLADIKVKATSYLGIAFRPAIVRSGRVKPPAAMDRTGC